MVHQRKTLTLCLQERGRRVESKDYRKTAYMGLDSVISWKWWLHRSSTDMAAIVMILVWSDSCKVSIWRRRWILPEVIFLQPIMKSIVHVSFTWGFEWTCETVGVRCMGPQWTCNCSLKPYKITFKIYLLFITSKSTNDIFLSFGINENKAFYVMSDKYT